MYRSGAAESSWYIYLTLHWVNLLLRYALLWAGLQSPAVAAQVLIPSPYDFAKVGVTSSSITYQKCGGISETPPILSIEYSDFQLLQSVVDGWESGVELRQKQSVLNLENWLNKQNDEAYVELLAANLVWMYFSLYQYPEAEGVLSRTANNRYLPIALDVQLILGEVALIKGELEKAKKYLSFVATHLPDSCTAMKLKLLVLSAELSINLDELNTASEQLYQAVTLKKQLPVNKATLPLFVNLHDTYGFLYISESRVKPDIKQALMGDALSAELIALNYVTRNELSSNNSIALHKQHLVVLSNLAWIYTQLFDYNNAENMLLSALQLLQDAPDRDLENHIYYLLGVNYLNLGLYDKAYVFLVNAATLAEPSDPMQFGRLSCLLSDVIVDGELEKPLSTHLAECSTLSGKKGVLTDDKIMSYSSQLKALQQLQSDKIKPLLIADRLEANILETSHENIRMTGFAALAEFAMETNNRALAERAFNEMQYEEASVTPTLQVKAKLLKYRFLTLKEVNDDALAFADDTHEYIVKVLQKLDTNELVPALQSQVFSFYQLWFEHLMQSNSEANAHKVLHVSIQLNQLTNGLAGTATNQSKNLMQVSELQAQVLDNDSVALSLQHHIAWDLERLKYAKANPASLSLQVVFDGSETNTIESLQARLKPSEQLLFYVAGASTGYVFGLTKNTLAFSSIGNLPALQYELREMHAQLSKRLPYDDQALTSLAKRIFPEGLVAPDKSVWYVVSNQIFQDIPVNGLALLLEQQPDAVIKLLSLATDESSTPDSVKSGFKLLSVPELTLNGSTQVPDWMAELKPLPWSAIEAESVTRLFKEADAQAIVGEQATRDALFSDEVKTASVLHIAAHHIYDPFKPQFVGLVLNAGAQDTLGSAFISEYEIRNQVFQNDLVFLNGCATAQGRHFVGSNTMSITRAFLIGGAKRVVSTLWEVADKASLNFASHYYQDYLRTKAPDKALLNTMRKMKTQPRYKHPFYWAGYELTQRHL